MKQHLLIGLAVLTIASTSFAGGPDYSHSKKSISSQRLTHNNCFNSINVDGNFTLELRQNKNKNCYSINAGDTHKNSVMSSINDKTLFIKSNNRRTKVILYTNPISNIRVYNNATVISKQFNDKRPLNIIVATGGSVNLKGRYNIASILQQSTRAISIQWANSDTITVNGRGDGKINLAGSAYQLRAKLCNNSILNAEYLRAKNVTIKTSNHASAKVEATDNLRAFAHDSSNIYFYKQPKHITRESSGSANVLQLGWNK